MPAEPLLSILIPYYNKPGLPRMLDSILAQSLKSLEVVVVDDGSRLSCREAVDAYRGRGLDARLIEHGVNKGTKEARLTGLEHARGRVLYFVDADDRLYGDEALERHVRLLLREGADIVHFNAVRQYPNGREQFFPRYRPYAPALDGKDIFAAYAALRSVTFWCKLFSADVCRACLPAARTLALMGTAEDIYLTSLFFSRARRYRGSELVGYRYYLSGATHKSAAGLRNMHAIAEWFGAWLRDGNFSPRIIDKFKANARRRALGWAVKLERACLDPDGGGFNRDVFCRLISGVDMAVLERALEYALAKGDGVPEKRRAAGLRIQKELSRLALERRDAVPLPGF